MYYFDVTDILLYIEKETTVSGIQRVSFEVIRRMVARLGADNVRLSYWDRRRRAYVSVESSFISGMEEFSADDLGRSSLARERVDKVMLLRPWSGIATNL